MCLQGALDREFRSQLPDAQESGIEHPAGFVGLVAFGSELRFLVVPAAETFAVFPAVSQSGYGATVHEAGDAHGDVCLVGALVGDCFELVSLGHLLLHQARPILGVGVAGEPVPFAFLCLDAFLPLGFIAFHRRTGAELCEELALLLVLDHLAGGGFLGPARFVGIADAFVAGDIFGREFRLRVRTNRTFNVARLSPLLVAEDQVSVRVAVNQDRYTVEFLLGGKVTPPRKNFHIPDGLDDEAVVDVGFFHSLCHFESPWVKGHSSSSFPDL